MDGTGDLGVADDLWNGFETLEAVAGIQPNNGSLKCTVVLNLSPASSPEAGGGEGGCFPGPLRGQQVTSRQWIFGLLSLVLALVTLSIGVARGHRHHQYRYRPH